jgi:hypothetical protein
MGKQTLIRENIVKKAIWILILSTLTLSMASCKWEAKFDYGSAVYSDDDTAVAAVKHTCEERQTLGNFYESRNHKVQILSGNPVSGSTLTPIGTPRAGNLRDLFYMKSKGYYLLGRGTEAGAPHTSTYEKISLSGQVTNIITLEADIESPTYQGPLPNQLRVIPNPSGETLGMMTVNLIGSDLEVEISILDADTLSVLGGPWLVTTTSILPGGLAWIDDQVLMLGSSGANPFGPGAFTGFEIGQSPQTLSGQTVNDLFPATSSSENSASGDTVGIDTTTGKLSIN